MMSPQCVMEREKMHPGNLSETGHCVLCHNIINYTNSETVEVVRQALEIVLPNLNLEKGDDHRICKPCSSRLFAAFNFKVTCMDTEDIISPHVSTHEPLIIELKVYLKVNGKIQLNDIWKNKRTCRLCLQFVTYGFVSLNEVDDDIIHTYIPQVNVNATKDPVICVSCFNSLQTHGDFLRNCLKAHEESKCVDKKDNIKCEITLEDDPDLHIMYKNIDKQFYINSVELKNEIRTDEGDQDNDTSSYKLDEKIIDNEGNRISENTGETEYARGLKCETKDQLNKNSSEIQMYSCNDKESENKDHSKIHLYKCEFCTYETKYKYNLKKHQTQHKDPSKIQMHKCIFCNYKAKNNSILRRHHLIHKDCSEVQMYRCDTCDYESKRKGVLKRHQLLHKNSTAIEMYKCEFCTYETKYKSNLQTHQTTHKDPSEIQMYKCDFCTYISKHKRGLKCHLLVHKDPSDIQMYKCDICDFETKHKGALKSHHLLHENPPAMEMYKCEFCTYETKYKSNLQTHQIKHKDASEIQMYKCDFCAYETKYKRSLKRHQLIHKVPSECI